MKHRTFIAVILTVALAVTGMTSTAARAGNDDVAKWIAGAVALGIIGAAISENNKRERRRDQAVARQHSQPNFYGYSGRRDHDGYGKKAYGHGKTYGHKQKRGHDGYQRGGRYLLPQGCQVRIRTDRGNMRGFGRRCLLNNYAHYNSLPHQCARRAHGNQGRVIYMNGCLRNHGYRTAGR